MKKLISVMAGGLVGGAIAYWVGGWLFPNNGDLGDIAQGFLRLGLGFLGFIVGMILGIGITRRRRP
jgi:hypothetical protein